MTTRVKSKHSSARIVAAVILLLAISIGGWLAAARIAAPGRILKALADNGFTRNLSITYPFDGTLFPPEIPAPTFRWKDGAPGVRHWLIQVTFQDGFPSILRLVDSLQWTPNDGQWAHIKQHSVRTTAVIRIIGARRGMPVSLGSVSIATSLDSVGAPLFYREVNLPFIDAVKDPHLIRWRFGSVAQKTRPPVVLDNLPVCGNCHSFSADGTVLGMDVDYANDKGSYAIVPVSGNMSLDSSDIITWSDYRRQDKEPTFGLLSQVSPDGKWVVSTVKDMSVFVPKPGIDFSQLFFPVKGILALYNRSSNAFSTLAGADDRTYVNSNPVWSPDGKYILFIRSKAYALKADAGQVLLTDDQCSEFLKEGKLFLYDIYRIPFNNGTGGVAQPLPGASNNGMSNYFPRYSPDGKWIIFCKAKSFSLLQPDSRLYIARAAGGEPRLMRCNRDCMNSWHSWSPNGKWLVFSSKAFSPYTQLFLTHIDEKGLDAPPVLLDRLTAPDRAANIPEFVNAPTNAISRIREHFVNDLSYLRAAREYAKAYEFDEVTRLFGKAIELNPRNAQAHYDLGTMLAMEDRSDEALSHLNAAIRLDSNFLMAYCNYANLCAKLGRLDDALAYYGKVFEGERRGKAGNGAASGDSDANSFLYAHSNAALIYVKLGYREKAEEQFAMALRISPASADLHCSLGDLYLTEVTLAKARDEYARAVALKPDFERAWYNLGVTYAKMKMRDKAVEALQKVLAIDPRNNDARKNIAFVKSEAFR